MSRRTRLGEGGDRGGGDRGRGVRRRRRKRSEEEESRGYQYLQSRLRE